MLSASAAFRAAPSGTIAADVVGALLTRWHYIALAAPLALFAIELRRVRRFVLIVLFASVVLAALQSFVDLRIRAMRWSSPVAISSLDKEHPTRRRFGALHGMSMMLLALQAAAAAFAVIAKEPREKEREEQPRMSNIPQQDTTIYAVVVNDDEQYSIWPVSRELPLGWTDTGFHGLKQACLVHIEQIWTDLRPKSLRSRMNQAGENASVESASLDAASVDAAASDQPVYRLIRNPDGLTTLAPAEDPIPEGWEDGGTAGSRDEVIGKL